MDVEVLRRHRRLRAVGMDRRRRGRPGYLRSARTCSGPRRGQHAEASRGEWGFQPDDSVRMWWMQRRLDGAFLEAEVEHVLGPMLSGNPSLLSDRRAECLATWATKTALVATLAWDGSLPPDPFREPLSRPGPVRVDHGLVGLPSAVRCRPLPPAVAVPNRRAVRIPRWLRRDDASRSRSRRRREPLCRLSTAKRRDESHVRGKGVAAPIPHGVVYLAPAKCSSRRTGRTLDTAAKRADRDA